ncbi:alpha-L-rhamnosidase [Agreia sp. Leaf283]|nr:alpha-L-rhamnosidase [Agreia sp. Leaf283]
MHDDARRVLSSIAPEVLESPMVVELADFPVAPIMGLILGDDDPRIDEIMKSIADYEDLSPVPASSPPIIPRTDYEPSEVVAGSASIDPIATARLHRRSELVLHGPSHGNPFVDVELNATFILGQTEISAGGFYDEDGTYRVRFLAPAVGTWTFATSSNARSLDGITGELQVVDSDRRGPVRVVDGHFAYANGTPHVPVGTTAYAWTNQTTELQDQTVQSLVDAPFNKIRMGLFPKSFMFNENEPDLFVFPRDSEGGWDTTRFDPEYFRNLERRLDELEQLGIEADLILFHPYDRWGFATLGTTADDRYTSYVTRRLAAFANVWWSMANEYDLITTKNRDDWDRLAGIVQENDHVDHLLSIHNWVDLFDYTADWTTHCSIQRGDHTIGKSVAQWKRRWQKPVVVDESGYEGDIDQGWGNLPAEEMVRRFWDATMFGGYLTHGETYVSDDDILWWSKGGTLQGDSLPRLAFLRRIIEQSPSGRIDPLPSDWDFPTGGAGNYGVTYYGGHRPRYRDIRIPEGRTAEIDVLDTWDMTIDRLPGIHTGLVRVDLPGKPYCAIRVVLNENHSESDRIEQNV